MRPRAAIRRSLGRSFGMVVAAAVGVAALASLAPPSPAISTCAAAGTSAGSGPNHVALVIEHGDGSVATSCVSFSDTSITGQRVLEIAAVSWSGQSFGGFGQAVCALDGEPAHYATCPGKDNYWAIFGSRAGGAWQLAAAGISTLTFSNGDAEGFRYVPATGTPATPPSPAGVCAAGPAATATATPSAPGSVAPKATSRPNPTSATNPLTGATPSPAAGSLAADAPTATPPDAVVAAATGPAAATDPAAVSSPSAAAGSSGPIGAAPAPSSGGGVDPGLLLAAVAGGALAGFGVLRLMAARRPPSPPPQP